MLVSEWRKFNDYRQRERARIKLLHPFLRTRDGRFDNDYIVFDLEDKSTLTHFPFLVGLEDRDTLNGELVTEDPGTSNPRLYRAWSEEMTKYIRAHYSAEVAPLQRILLHGVQFYALLVDHPERYESLKPLVSTSDKLVPKFIYQVHSNPKVVVTLESNYHWNIVVSAQHAKISATLIAISSSNGGVFCDYLRVLSPRLALGGNVDFGGLVTGKGIGSADTSKDIPALLDAIVSLLDEEVPMLESIYLYTNEEFEAVHRIGADKISSGERHLGTYRVVSSVFHSESNSSVAISNREFARLIGEKEFLWLKLVNHTTGKEMWLSALPSEEDLPTDLFLVSDVVLCNLNCNSKDPVSVWTGDLPSIDKSGVTLRARGSNADLSLIQTYVEGMNCVQAGMTYSVGSGIYFDVFYAGQKGVSSLKVGSYDRPEEVSLNFEKSLKLLHNPLDIDEYSSEEDEGSD